MKKLSIFICLILLIFSCNSKKEDDLSLIERMNLEAKKSLLETNDVDSDIKENKITLSYESNLAESGEPPKSKIFYSNQEDIVISANVGNLARTDYIFIGWNTKEDGTGKYYFSNEIIKTDSNLHLYASWKEYDLPEIEYKGIKFLRSLQTAEDEFKILYRIDNDFYLSESTYEEVIDPYVTEEDAYRLINKPSKRIYGFNSYENHRFNNKLIPVKINGKYGFINIEDNFEIEIEPQFDDVHPFKENLAAINIEGKWGYIDQQGQIVISPQFDFVFDFFNELSIVGIGTHIYKDINYGIIDINGQIILDPNISNNFEYICSFYAPQIAKAELKKEGLAVINRSGEVLIDRLYNVGDRGGPIDPAYFMYGYDLEIMVYSENGRNITYGREETLVGAFNKIGEWVIEPQQISDEEIELKRKLYKAEPDQIFSYKDPITGLYGYININREWILKPKYDYARNFVDGNAIVVIDDKYGVIDESGNWIIEPILDNIYHLSNGLFNAKYVSNWGIINDNGIWLLEPKYRYSQPLVNIDDPIFVYSYEYKGFKSHDGNEIYKFKNNETTIPFKDGISFIYKPIGEEYWDENEDKLLRKFEVKPISKSGKALFEEIFYEVVELNDM